MFEDAVGVPNAVVDDACPKTFVEGEPKTELPVLGVVLPNMLPESNAVLLGVT